MAIWPNATLRLIQPMSMVLVPHLPEVRYETVYISKDGGVHPGFDSYRWLDALTITDPRFALEYNSSGGALYVRVIVDVIHELQPSTVIVYLALNGIVIATLWRDDGQTCGYSVQTKEVYLLATQFNALRGGEYPLNNAVFTLWTNAMQNTCPTKQFRVRATYYAQTPPEIIGRAYLKPWTNHKTLIAGPDETRGVPHYHRASLRVNAMTGKFVVVSESLDGKLTLGGFQATPAAADGSQIPTRQRPGSMECLLTGEIGGVVMRIGGDGNPVLE